MTIATILAGRISSSLRIERCRPVKGYIVGAKIP
jgi:hypothetical protein